MQNDVYGQSLSLEGYFHIYGLTMESFYVLTENLSLRDWPTAMICDVTTSFESIVIRYATYKNMMWKLEACSAHRLRMDFTVK